MKLIDFINSLENQTIINAQIKTHPYKSNVELYEEKIGKAVPEDISDKD